MKTNDKNKIGNRIFKWFIFILFVTFLTLYISQATGYFTYEQSRKVAFTNDQIQKFEQDIKDGKEIDVNEYLEHTNKNYQTSISSFTLKLSEGISKYTRIGIEKIFTKVSNWIEG